MPSLTVTINAARPFECPLRTPIAQFRRIEFRRSKQRTAQRDDVDDATRLSIFIADQTASALHAFISQDVPGEFRIWDCDSRNGTSINGDRLIGQRALRPGDVIRIGSTFVVFSIDSRHDVASLEDSLDGPSATLCAPLADALRRSRQQARSEQPILIHGPAGAGHEQTARWLHSVSGRTGRFVRVSALGFMHELELFRRARRGTVFLDNVHRLSDSNLEVLVSLLDPADWQRPENETGPSFAVIASSQVEPMKLPNSLRAAVAQHRLFLPPLANRRTDLGFLLARELLAAGAATHLTLSRQFVEYVMNHAWPGNLYELAAVVRQTLAASDGGVVTLRNREAETTRATALTRTCP